MEGVWVEVKILVLSIFKGVLWVNKEIQGRGAFDDQGETFDGQDWCDAF